MAKKGEPKTGGRRPGSLNKTTSTVKEVMVSVFNEMQQEPENSLKTWAVKNHTAFYNLTSKLIPAEMKVELPKDGVNINLIFPPGE